MKKILFTLVFTLFYLPLCGFSQSDIHTPNKSEPAAFKLAKVYFLPDWSDKGMSFDGTDEKPCTEVCPQKTSYDCASGQTETYTNSCGNTCVRCIECYGCEAKGYILTECPDNGICDNSCCNKLYKLTGCNEGYVLDGSSCRAETCSDNPDICGNNQKCSNGECVDKSCDEDQSVCSSSETCVKGECVAKDCNNTEGLCLAGEKCQLQNGTYQCVCSPNCVDADDCEYYGEPISNGCGGTCMVCREKTCADVSCSEGEICNSQTLTCEKTATPEQSCIDVIKEQYPNVTFVNNKDEWAALSSKTENVILLKSIEVSSISISSGNRSVYTLQSYNDSLWQGARDKRISECNQINSYSIRLKTQTIKVSNSKKLQLFVPTEAEDATVKEASLIFGGQAKVNTLTVENGSSNSTAAFYKDAVIQKFTNKRSSSSGGGTLNIMTNPQDEMKVYNKLIEFQKPHIIIFQMDIEEKFNLRINLANLSTYYVYWSGSSEVFNLNVMMGTWYLPSNHRQGFYFSGANTNWRMIFSSGCLADTSIACEKCYYTYETQLNLCFDINNTPAELLPADRKDLVEDCKICAPCVGYNERFSFTPRTDAGTFWCAASEIHFAKYTDGSDSLPSYGAKSCNVNGYIIGSYNVDQPQCLVFSSKNSSNNYSQYPYSF